MSEMMACSDDRKQDIRNLKKSNKRCTHSELEGHSVAAGTHGNRAAGEGRRKESLAGAGRFLLKS